MDLLKKFSPSFESKKIHKTWHSNVYWMLIFRFISGLAFATRSAAIFDNYIRMQFGDNTTIGLIASSSAVAQLIAAPCAAILSDHFKGRRSETLRAFGIFGLFCATINYLGIITNSLKFLISSSFFWSIWYQMVNIVSESLLTDSIPPDLRSQVFVYKRITATLSRGIGPLITLGLFLWCGDTWDLETVRTVLKLGLSFSFLQVWALFFWIDIEKTQLESERNKRTNIKLRYNLFGLGLSSLPWIIFISHNVTFLGAGMTIKYFPLFFIKEYNFKPIHTCILSVLYSASIALFTYALYHLSKYFGRTTCALGSSILAIIMLYLLSKSRNLTLVVALYLIRGGLQNADSPLNRSLTQEVIPNNQRGRWLAIESISGASWSVSAILGGLIADAKDYRYTFMITGLFYIAGSILYSPCLLLIREETNYESFDSNEESSEKLLNREI